MINKNTIGQYINFLHLKKNGTPASPALMQKWSALSDADIATQLQHFYTNSGYSKEHVAIYEKQFAATLNNVNEPIKTPTQSSTINKVAKKGNYGVLIKLLAAILIIAGIYVGGMYYNFKNYKYIYAITDNITVRNSDGDTVTNMSIKPISNEFASLRVVDKEQYAMVIDNTNKPKLHRKVIVQDGDFIKYLFNKKQCLGYVNINFVVDSKAELDKYLAVFKAMDGKQTSMLELRFKKVIVNSINLYAPIKDLYVLPGCTPTNRKKFLPLIKTKLIAENDYMVVAQLSDGYYYIFSGDLSNNKYKTPRRVNLKGGSLNETELNGNKLFAYNSKDKTFSIFDCSGNALGYTAVLNADYTIDYFESIAPTEDTFFDNIIDGVNNAAETINEIKELVK